MLDLVDIQNIFVSWYNNLIGFWDFLVADNFGQHLIGVAEEILEANYNSIIGWGAALIGGLVDLVFGDASLLLILLGASLTFYVSYQLITWLLNIVT